MSGRSMIASDENWFYSVYGFAIARVTFGTNKLYNTYSINNIFC